MPQTQFAHLHFVLVLEVRIQRTHARVLGGVSTHASRKPPQAHDDFPLCLAQEYHAGWFVGPSATGYLFSVQA